MADWMIMALTDGFGGYDWSVESMQGLIHVGCLAHMRRKFTDAANIGTIASSAREALSLIAKIYAIERALASWDRDERFRAERERRVRALFERVPTFDPNGDHDELLPCNITLRKPEGY